MEARAEEAEEPKRKRLYERFLEREEVQKEKSGDSERMSKFWSELLREKALREIAYDAWRNFYWWDTYTDQVLTSHTPWWQHKQAVELVLERLPKDELKRFTEQRNNNDEKEAQRAIERYAWTAAIYQYLEWFDYGSDNFLEYLASNGKEWEILTEEEDAELDRRIDEVVERVAQHTISAIRGEAYLDDEGEAGPRWEPVRRDDDDYEQNSYPPDPSLTVDPFQPDCGVWDDLDKILDIIAGHATRWLYGLFDTNNFDDETIYNISRMILLFHIYREKPSYGLDPQPDTVDRYLEETVLDRVVRYFEQGWYQYRD